MLPTRPRPPAPSPTTSGSCFGCHFDGLASLRMSLYYKFSTWKNSSCDDYMILKEYAYIRRHWKWLLQLQLMSCQCGGNGKYCSSDWL
uniref:Uncharacterized protein n=1 Tax=Physcomitrium patens TaxID=3218 RepID=A0A2K1KGP8_PHYPA|nr:hypothetical protein PHYPA_009327 [Physcomitrium patens]